MSWLVGHAMHQVVFHGSILTIMIADEAIGVVCWVNLNKTVVLHWCWRRGKHSEKIVDVSYEVRGSFCFRD